MPIVGDVGINQLAHQSAGATTGLNFNATGNGTPGSGCLRKFNVS